MNTGKRGTAQWATSAFGDPPVTSPEELSALKVQLDECRHARGRMFSVRCKVEAMDGVFANRMMTMVVVVVLLLCAVSVAYLLP